MHCGYNEFVKVTYRFKKAFVVFKYYNAKRSPECIMEATPSQNRTLQTNETQHFNNKMRFTNHCLRSN